MLRQFQKTWNHRRNEEPNTGFWTNILINVTTETANEAKKVWLFWNTTTLQMAYLIFMDLRQISLLVRKTKTRKQKFFNRTQPGQIKGIPTAHLMQLLLGTPVPPWPGETPQAQQEQQ